jgi:hypothetical protein
MTVSVGVTEWSTDYVLTESGLQYKDFRVGVEGAATPQKGERVVVDWDGCEPNTPSALHLALCSAVRHEGSSGQRDRDGPVRTAGGLERTNASRDCTCWCPRQPAGQP